LFILPIEIPFVKKISKGKNYDLENNFLFFDNPKIAPIKNRMEIHVV